MNIMHTVCTPQECTELHGKNRSRWRAKAASAATTDRQAATNRADDNTHGPDGPDDRDEYSCGAGGVGAAEACAGLFISAHFALTLSAIGG